MCSQVEASDWRYPFFEYFQHGRLPEDPNKKTEFRRRLPIYIYQNHTLYKRSYDQVWLRCLWREEADDAILLKRYTLVYVVDTSLDPRCITNWNSWVIIGPGWCVIVYKPLISAINVRYMVIESIGLRHHFIQRSLRGHSLLGALMLSDQLNHLQPKVIGSFSPQPIIFHGGLKQFPSGK